nr:CbiX/SirB N-terminal domain-containing protein [Xylanimonas oleitrophica]
MGDVVTLSPAWQAQGAQGAQGARRAHEPHDTAQDEARPAGRPAQADRPAEQGRPSGRGEHGRSAVRVLLATSHGTSSDDGARAVSALVDAVAARLGDEADVRPAFVDVQQPDLPAALAAVPPDREAVVVPLLLSAGYHVHVDATQAVAARGGASLAPALGPDDRLVDVLADRAAEAGLGPDDELVLVAAGSSDARALHGCEETASRLAARLGRPRSRVRLAYLSAARPRAADAVAAARAERPAARVVALPYLLAPGFFVDLAAKAGADVTAAPLLTGGAPDPRLVDLVVERFHG